jgi:hypothetical protein
LKEKVTQEISSKIATVKEAIKVFALETEKCSTPACINAAKNILEKMDQSVKPCDDFYSFACGQYVKNTVIPEDKVSVDSFSETRDTLQNQLKTIIMAPVDETDIEPIKKVKKLYSACLNKSKDFLPLQKSSQLILFVQLCRTG